MQNYFDDTKFQLYNNQLEQFTDIFEGYYVGFAIKGDHGIKVSIDYKA